MYGDKMSLYSRLLPELIEHEGKTKTIIKVSNPEDLPPVETCETIAEPIAKIEIITPKDYVGALMTLCQERRGIFKNQQFIDVTRTMLTYELPMSELIGDFYDEMKSLSSGYGSLNYEFVRYSEDDLVKLDILIAGERVAALSLMCHRDQARYI
jgi:GTP-binding protein LepA